MTFDQVITKHNFLSKLLLQDGEKNLSKELKIRIMNAKIEYSKIHQAFDKAARDFVNTLTTDEVKQLQSKQEKTDEDMARLKELSDEATLKYREFIAGELAKECEASDIIFSDDDFNEIVDVNSGNDVEINNSKMSASDFLEILHGIFVEI